MNAADTGRLESGAVSDANSTSEGELVDMGYDLLTPTNSIIAYTEMLLTYAENEPAVEEFISDLNKMLVAAEQLAALINRFFARENSSIGEIDVEAISSTIRHDLRTPINAVLGYGEMIIEDLSDGGDQEDMCNDLQRILTSARRLLTLINDLTYVVPSGSTEAGRNRNNNNAAAAAAAAAASAPLENKAPPKAPPPETSEVATPPANPQPETAAVADQKTLMDDVVRTMRSNNQQQVEMGIQDARLLVVDDKDSNRDLLSRRLSRQGFQVEVSENGVQALEMIRAKEQEQGYDLVLLDIIMPEMDGYQVLATLKADKQLRHLPVIMISALDEIDSVVRCIEMGAEDYLQKPFNQVILKAKIFATLERKRLRDREHAFMQKLQAEQEKSEKLLLNILPKPIADRLKKGDRTIADSFPEVTVMFSDLVKFTELSAGITAAALVEKLNEIFLAFDLLADQHGLEKIKTIGDSYMLVGGLPTPREDHAEAVAAMALDMFDAIERLNQQNNSNFKIRVGIHTGPVVAGVIGKNKFNYDLWGDAVNVASRMESHGVPGKIQISETTYQKVKDKFILEKRGIIEVKGKGEMVTYMLLGHK